MTNPVFVPRTSLGAAVYLETDVQITITLLPGGTQGEAYGVQMLATENATWQATGLPAGLGITPTGLITGRPLVYGQFNVFITANAVDGSVTEELSLTIAPAATGTTGTTTTVGSSTGEGTGGQRGGYLRRGYRPEDFGQGFANLMPPGRAWPRDLDSLQRQLENALALSTYRQTVRSEDLLDDAFPGYTVELLPEWEATVGLPDPCAGDTPTVQQRRNQVVARLVGAGGQSIAGLTSFAANLGYQVEIGQYDVARVGLAQIGDPINGEAWAHAWSVQSVLNTVTYARVGISAIGEPLAYWGNEVLECEMAKVAPAHTVVNFQYN